MRQALRIVGIVLGLLCALVLTAIAYVTASFDADRVKDELTRMVLEKKQRTLRFDGELSLSFWPGPGVRLGQVSLSERGGNQPFAALEAARVSVQVLPLLSKQIVIDQVELSGVQASLLRHQDGTLNIDDLLAKDENPTVKFDLAGFKIGNTQLTWRDEIKGRELALINLNLTTGHLANAAQGKLELSAKLKGNQPKIDSTLQLSANYDYDMDRRRFEVSALDARIAGMLAGMQGVDMSIGAGAIRNLPRGDKSELQLEALVLSVKGKEGGDGFELNLAAPMLTLTTDNASSNALTLSAKLAGARYDFDARLDLSGIEGNSQTLKVARLGLLLDAQAGDTAFKGKLSSTCVLNLSAQTMELPSFSSEIAVANPQMPMKQVKLPISGILHADFSQQSAEGTASTQFDESKIAAKFNLARFTPLTLGFAVDIDRLDVDKYLPPRRDGGKKVPATGGEEKLAPQLFGGSDLSALKNSDLNLYGTVNIGALQFAGVKARKVRLELKAADGKLEMGTAASLRSVAKRSIGR